MSEYYPPTVLSDVFNSTYFTDLDGNLSLALADLRYLKLTGGIVSGLTTFSNSLSVVGTLSINGSAVDLSLITGVTAGTATASKVLSLDASSNVTGINSLSATSLTGTILTPSQPNITSLGTLPTLTATLITGTLQTAAQPNITSVGTLTSLTSGNIAITKASGSASLILTSTDASDTFINLNRGSTVDSNYDWKIRNNGNAILFSSQSSGAESTWFMVGNTGTLFSLNTDASTSSSVGSFVCAGSIAISLATDASSSTNGGTITTAGGVGIGKSLYVGTTLSSGAITTTFVNNTGSLLNLQTWTNDLATDVIVALQMSSSLPRFGTTSAHGMRLCSNNAVCAYFDTSGNLSLSTGAPSGSYKLEFSGSQLIAGAASILAIANTTASTNSSSGAIQCQGGAYFGSNSVFNSNLLINGSSGSSGAGTGAVQLAGGIYVAGASYFANNLITGPGGYTAFNGDAYLNGPVTYLNNASSYMWFTQTGNYIKMSNTNASTSSTTGAIQCAAGGCYFGAGSIFGSTLTVNGTCTSPQFSVSLGGGDTWIRQRSGVKAENTISNYFCYNSTNINSAILTSSGTGSFPFCWPSQSISYLGTDEVVWGKTSVTSTVGNNVIAMSKDTMYYTNTVKVKTQSNTNSQMIIKRLRVDNGVTDTSTLANLSIKCDSTNVVDANYSLPIAIESLHATPIQFDFQMHRASGATTTNGVFIGTRTLNDLSFQTNNARRMTIASDGNVGIGISVPLCPLDVNGTGPGGVTFGAGGTSIYGYGPGVAGAWTLSNYGTGPQSYAISARFSGSITMSNILQTSDRRLKENIKPLEWDLERFYKLETKKFNLIGSDEPEIGFVAQDVLNGGWRELIGFSPNDKLKAKDEVLIDGMQLNLKYDRITIINFEMIKKLMERIDTLEKALSNKIKK